MILKCPRCSKETETTGNPFRPFCSKRCRLIDLGNWISGTYHIPEKEPEETDDEEFIPRKDLNEE